MSSKVKIELNREGVRELMRSPEMQAILQEQAAKIAGESETETFIAKTRAVVKVMGGNSQARTGKQVKGYYRTGKNGQKIWVNSYQRRK